MSEFKLKANQSALIVSVSPEGEVSVDAVYPDKLDDAGELAAEICNVVGQKLTDDEEFQNEIMTAVEEREN